jgi:hypothetical protein
VEALGGKVEAAEKVASEAKTLAEKADQTLTETVVGSAPGDQNLSRRFRARTRKREGGHIPLMDSSRSQSGD